MVFPPFLFHRVRVHRLSGVGSCQPFPPSQFSSAVVGKDFVIGPGYSPIPHKLVTKITTGLFVKLADSSPRQPQSERVWNANVLGGETRGRPGSQENLSKSRTFSLGWRRLQSIPSSCVLLSRLDGLIYRTTSCSSSRRPKNSLGKRGNFMTQPFVRMQLLQVWRIGLKWIPISTIFTPSFRPLPLQALLTPRPLLHILAWIIPQLPHRSATRGMRVIADGPLAAVGSAMPVKIAKGIIAAYPAPFRHLFTHPRFLSALFAF